MKKKKKKKKIDPAPGTRSPLGLATPRVGGQCDE